MAHLIYSAYHAAPPDLTTDTDLEMAWYSRLRAEPRIDGLELAVLAGGLHPEGTGRLADLLAPHWSNTVSAMSLTLGAVATDPAYGLASKDDEGRRRALDDIDAARIHALQLCDQLGEGAVRAFAVQSAPRADRSEPERFHESLAEIVEGDWQGIELLVEHSDALIAGQPPQKGYLSLADELSVVASLQGRSTRMRHLLNWGRSAIEGHSDATPLAHVAESGPALGAFAFSGAAASSTARSGEWEDVHLGLSDDEPGSLLTDAAVDAVLQALPGGLNYVGVKAGAAAGATGLNRLDVGLALLGRVTA